LWLSWRGLIYRHPFRVKAFDGFATGNGVLVLPGHVRERFCTKGLMGRTYLKTNAYLSEGFVLPVPSKYFQSVFKLSAVLLLEVSGRYWSIAEPL